MIDPDRGPTPSPIHSPEYITKLETAPSLRSNIWSQLTPLLRLTRVTTAFAAVGNVWFVILWSRAFAVQSGSISGGEVGTDALRESPLILLLTASAAQAIGLFTYGACLNDILDIRRDRELRPDRPLASGGISLEAALASVTLSLVLAITGATFLGTPAVLLTLVLAIALLVFNAFGKFVPGVGFVVLGLVYAGHMGVPNAHLRFMWPVWLVMTHALGLALATHILARRVPRVSKRAVVSLIAGWASWSFILWALSWRRNSSHNLSLGLWVDWVEPTAWIWPMLLALAFIAVAIWKAKNAGTSHHAAEKVWRYGSLWLTLYAAAWLFGAGAISEGFILLALAGAGFLGMTILREAYGLLDKPLEYRRM